MSSIIQYIGSVCENFNRGTNSKKIVGRDQDAPAKVSRKSRAKEKPSRRSKRINCSESQVGFSQETESHQRVVSGEKTEESLLVHAHISVKNVQEFEEIEEVKVDESSIQSQKVEQKSNKPNRKSNNVVIDIIQMLTSLNIDTEYFGDNSAELRNRAFKYAQLKNEFFYHSKEAWNHGLRLEAKILSNKGRMCSKIMDQSNSRAAHLIFTETNEKKPLDHIDLHYLYVSEALPMLEERIALLKKLGKFQLTVIVGRGKRSLNEPKLKPAVISFAQNKNIRFTSEFPNVGCVRLFLDMD